VNEMGEIETGYSFTAERQRESFSLKAPFCSGAVFRFESNLPCRVPCYVYLPTRIQRTGKKRLRTRYVSERGKFRVRSVEGKQPFSFSLSLSLSLSLFSVFLSRRNRERRRPFSIRLSDVPDAITFSRCEW